ncbi:MAG TPA: hypothetical protein VKM93_08865 [Terriglobia bacterium]|nr:hypothetical protein [Terriglobia bacterium]
MVWLLVLVIGLFLAILFKWIPRTLRIFAGSWLLRICGVTLFVASVFVALTAVGGGVTVAAGVDKFSADWLIGTPFGSYLIPGLILAVVVGGSAVVAAVAALCGLDAGALASVLAGAILLGWLAGERLILPSAAFSPQFWWLEAIYVAAGLMMVVPALTVRWAERGRQSPPSGGPLVST